MNSHLGGGPGASGTWGQVVLLLALLAALLAAISWVFAHP
jgi:hypothetical protein